MTIEQQFLQNHYEIISLKKSIAEFPSGSINPISTRIATISPIVSIETVNATVIMLRLMMHHFSRKQYSGDSILSKS